MWTLNLPRQLWMSFQRKPHTTIRMELYSTTYYVIVSREVGKIGCQIRWKWMKTEINKSTQRLLFNLLRDRRTVWWEYLKKTHWVPQNHLFISWREQRITWYGIHIVSHYLWILLLFPSRNSMLRHFFRFSYRGCVFQFT